MPIQNVGTRLENMVTEAAALLLDRVRPNERLGFASAFAMPALSEWRPHPQAIGMSTQALHQVLESSDQATFERDGPMPSVSI
jgi:hypothetical protein